MSLVPFRDGRESPEISEADDLLYNIYRSLRWVNTSPLAKRELPFISVLSHFRLHSSEPDSTRSEVDITFLNDIIANSQIQQAQADLRTRLAQDPLTTPTMSARQTSRVPTDSVPQGSGLVQAAYSTGRERGSSATPTPALMTPKPKKGFQKSIDLMNNTSITGNTFESFSENSHSGSARYGSSHTRDNSSTNTSQYGQHHRNSSSGASLFQAQDQDSSSSTTHLSNLSQGSDGLINTDKTMTMNELAQYLKTQLVQLENNIKSSSGVGANLQTILINECRRINIEFHEKQRALRNQFEKIKNDKIQLGTLLDETKHKLNECQQKLRAAKSERDQAMRNQHSLQTRIEELLREAAEKKAEWEVTNRQLSVLNDTLTRQISVQEEQLAGKRALWLESNPGSSARRDAMNAIRDPFQSPTASHSAQFGGKKSGMASPTLSSFGPPPQMTLPTGPRGPRRRGGIPTNRGHPNVEPPMPLSRKNSTRAEISEADDILGPLQSMSMSMPSGSMSTALVPYRDSEDYAAEFTGDFGKLYGLIEGWVKLYAKVPNLPNDQNIARSNNVLWEYMMNCAYPGQRQDSHNHVMVLLNDRRARFWFIMRMCVTYCVNEIIAPKAFKPYSTYVRDQLTEVEIGLQTRGLNNEARQALVDQQARAVQSVLSAKDYQNFRKNQLINHTKRLRDMLGSMLDGDASRTDAGRDLGAIAIAAWELSTKMHTAQLTFQVYFPETAAKFTAATMVAKDQPHTPSMELQLRQTRLKLVITPVITMRDDRGTTIKAKNLHHSTVLTMG